MIYTDQTKKAMQLAYRAHHGQTDKGGVPYLFHVMHVAEQMTDEITTTAALLHDILEDTEVTEDYLWSAGFSAEVIQAVTLLTRDPAVPYLDYVRTLRANPVAAAVKLADLSHNSDLSRLAVVDDAAKERVQRYRAAMDILRTTEVVAALLWDGDTFMICQRPAHKARGLLWEFVGGKVEPDETPQQALVRECREELAVTVVPGDVFMEVTHAYPDLTVHLTLFHASIAQGTPQNLEHNDIRWITPQETDSYDFCPADVEILAKIQQEYA